MFDLRDELRTVTVPTTGRHSQPPHMSWRRPCHGVVLPRSAHMLPYEEPDEFNEALLGFLART